MIQKPAMRAILPLLPLTLLASCGGGTTTTTANATVEDDGRIECRLGADTNFERYCTLERTREADGTLLTVKKPDGGFRRLKTTRDGRGVIAADGAESAEVKIAGDNLIEVSIAGDTFRLPARIGPVSAPSK